MPGALASAHGRFLPGMDFCCSGFFNSMDMFDAFRYLGRAYDIEVRGIQGISTDSEAGVKQINDLVKFLSERKIKAVFVETSVSDQNIRSLLEGSSASGHKVVIGGELFSDAMGNEGTPEGTYEGMVRHNVETIVKALK
jgi:manganese/zinc/iron transport system substrate-binding protein